MKVEKILLVEGQSASYNFPQLNLNIMVLDNKTSVMTVTEMGKAEPLSTKGIASFLHVEEADVCRFLQCEPNSNVIKTIGDTDGVLAKLRWGCLNGFAGAKTA